MCGGARDGVARGPDGSLVGVVTRGDPGYFVAADVLPAALLPPLAALFDRLVGERPGRRGALREAVVQQVACCQAVRALVEPLLGAAAFAFRATLFDKSAAADWALAWHQDRMVPVVARTDAAGFGPWSTKDDGVHVQPPLAVLQQLLAVRLDLDGSGPANGGLQVVPGSHAAGLLDPGAMTRLAQAGVDVPVVPKHGALCMRPLLVHASARSRAAGPRRIVHLEFAPAPLPLPTCYRMCVR